MTEEYKNNLSDNYIPFINMIDVNNNVAAQQRHLGGHHFSGNNNNNNYS